MLGQVFGSPFEADAQVAHLVRTGLADAVATSDSDIYTFGSPMTLYGHFLGGKKAGSMVQWQKTCSPKINSMNLAEVVTMTCLTGCDYIPRLRGMSLTKAIATTLSWRDKPESEIQTDLAKLEEELSWPNTKGSNQELFPYKKNGPATGFVNRFHMARAAFMAHRVRL